MTEITAAAAAIINGDRRAAARLISRIENGDAGAQESLQQLRKHRGLARVLGLTGAPGCGKSTLVDQLIVHYRQSGEQVAVLAVDPSSPFSGGAILGDRVRLQRHASDEGVFIRSMASRGALGGLAKATGAAIDVLTAMPWDTIIIETIGVGQNEIDIVHHADVVILVETPASGDAVQSIKSGIMEIGDVLVVNKSDQVGADRRVKDLEEATRNSRRHYDRAPAVLKTDARFGVGIAELVAAIESLFVHHKRPSQTSE